MILRTFRFDVDSDSLFLLNISDALISHIANASTVSSCFEFEYLSQCRPTLCDITRLLLVLRKQRSSLSPVEPKLLPLHEQQQLRLQNCHFDLEKKNWWRPPGPATISPQPYHDAENAEIGAFGHMVNRMERMRPLTVWTVLSWAHPRIILDTNHRFWTEHWAHLGQMSVTVFGDWTSRQLNLNRCQHPFVLFISWFKFSIFPGPLYSSLHPCMPPPTPSPRVLPLSLLPSFSFSLAWCVLFLTRCVRIHSRGLLRAWLTDVPAAHPQHLTGADKSALPVQHGACACAALCHHRACAADKALFPSLLPPPSLRPSFPLSPPPSL